MDDVEEGEITDTSSSDEVKMVVGRGRTTMVWTLANMYENQFTRRGKVTNLANLAWARAVRNKPPRDEVTVETVGPTRVAAEETSKQPDEVIVKTIEPTRAAEETNKLNVDVVDLEEEEEGKLEEGEIELDSCSGPGDGDEEMSVDGGRVSENSEVGLVKEALGSVSVGEVEKSFDGGCGKLQNALEGLREVPRRPDGLVPLLVSAVRAISSVFGSMDRKLKEQNKDILSRLVSEVKTYHLADFLSEQMKELDVMIASADANDEQSTTLVEEWKLLEDTFEMMDNEKDSVSKGAVQCESSDNSSVSAETFEADKPSSSLEASKSNFRSRCPLLDLHKIHDLDSLPTSTLEMSPSYIVAHKMPNIVNEIGKPEPPLPKVDAVSLMNPHETDTIKAVSRPGSTTVKPLVGKRRDPRLGILKPGPCTPSQDHPSLSPASNSHKVEPVGVMMSSRKNKLLDDPIADGPIKRQRNMSEVSTNDSKIENGTGGGGRLEENDMVGPQSKKQIHVPLASSTSGNWQVPMTGTPLMSLLQLLKNIADNPTMVMNILKMEQQKIGKESQNLADQAKSASLPLSADSILGAIPPVILPRPAGTASVEEAGKIRLKPKDPRRALHANTLQRTGSLSGDPPRINVIPSSIHQLNKDIQHVDKQEGQADEKSITSQPSVLPDVSLPSAHSLKNIAREVAVAASRSQSAWGDVEHLFEGYDDEEKAMIQQERARRIDEQSKMFAARKLCLVLDLDHTLLNSATFSEVDPVHDEILRKKEEQERGKPYKHLFRFPQMAMWTKLRPGVWNFLEKASKLFELHLYTMGNKLYATEIAKVLDPTGVLFCGRVISRGDDEEPFDGEVPKSKDLEGVLGMESSVIIVDDTIRVWPHNKLNLIVVDRYIYFPSSRRHFGLQGPSLLEIDHDERPEDGMLACSLAVIERIHHNFFNHQHLEEADVRNILASEQRKILAGCCIVFSRIIPVGEANPHLHPLWQTAEQFGAVCTNQMDERVTHVVASSPGTDKVKWALASGKFVVHPGWVEASSLLYRRANEQDFAIKR